MRKHYGKCALCGIEGELTYEHIPPRAANNNHPVKTVVFTPGINPYQETIEQLPWDMDGMKYINQQKGYGLYTLCAQCNNNIGSWYSKAYEHLILYVREHELYTGVDFLKYVHVEDDNDMHEIVALVEEKLAKKPYGNYAQAQRDVIRFINERNKRIQEGKGNV